MERDMLFECVRIKSAKARLKEVSTLTEADILAQDIYSKDGRKILSQNTSVNGYVKSLLRQNGTGAAKVVNFTLASTQLQAEETRILQIAIRHTFCSLASGQKIEYALFKNLAESLWANNDDNHFTYIKKLMVQMHQYDLYTYTHCVNVSFYSMLIAGWLGLSAHEIRQAVECGLLHDVGKAEIPIELLNKPDALTIPEYERLKQHATLGYDILRNYDSIDGQIKNAVLMHHERMDGSGYPFGVVPDDTLTNIIAVADVYDAITTDRVYKKRQNPFKAFEFFADKGSGLFDQRVLDVVLSNFSALLVGSEILLTSGENAKIAYVPPRYPCSMILEKDGRYSGLYDLNSIAEIVPQKDIPLKQ